MPNCVICGKGLSLTGNKLIRDGKMCKDCWSKISPLALEQIDFYDTADVENAIRMENELYEQFSVTASFGSLHMDEVHGLFAISKKLKDDKPEERNVFSVYDLEEAGLYCKSPVVDHENVFVDVEFSCKLSNPQISIKEVVKKRCKCSSKRVNNKEIEWQIPHDMEMFRTMFNYMLSGAFEKLNKMMCGRSVKDRELDKAKALFMIKNDNYTQEYLDETRMSLKQAFDTHERGCEESLQIIEGYYNLLRNNLNKNRA